MKDYSEYSYRRALRFFEAYYPYDVEPVHYEEVMLSMTQCKTIDELLSVRERLKKKIKKIDLYLTNKLPEDIFNEITSCDSRVSTIYFDKIKTNLIADVNSCYDENIFRLLRENETVTANACGECFINLSTSSTHSQFKDLIIQEAKERANVDVTELLDSISKRREDFEKHWSTLNGFKKEMNGYFPAKQTVEEDFTYLKQFNWRLLPNEKALYSIIDIEEIGKRKEREKLRKEHEVKRIKQIEEKWKLRKKENEIKKRKILIRKTWAKIIGIILLVMVIIYLLITVLPPIDGTIMNWFFAIIVILALLKKG